jgi:hypothetical protein
MGRVMGEIEVASDARHERMDRVAVLFGEITAATRDFLAALARSDHHRDWEDEGFGSCAEWLAWRIGITRGTANEKVRAARALEHLPLVSDAMARGELSFTKVRALTRAATPESEAELLTFARASSAANLERLVRGLLTPEVGAALDTLVRRNRERGITPDFTSGAPTWNSDRDIPWAIEAAAMEAIDPWEEPAA